MSGVAPDAAVAAQDPGFADRVIAAATASFQAAFETAFRTELHELQAASRELSARTEELEQFVQGLKPEAADPVVRRQEHHGALCVIEAKWLAGDNQLRDELATTQTLAQELKASVDELMTLKDSVEEISARVPANKMSPWTQELYTELLKSIQQELQPRVQEDVQRRLDAALKEHRRDSATTHQQNQLDNVNERMNNLSAQLSKIRFELGVEDSPMPRTARGAARGGMRVIPLNGRPAEAADVSVEGSAGVARGRRGDRRLTFEDERAPDETPEGAEYRRGSGGRPSMFRFEQETEERAEEEHGAQSSSRTYHDGTDRSSISAFA